MKEYFTFKYKETPTQIKSKVFYEQLLRDVEVEYPDLYFSFSIGGITFNSLVYTLNSTLKKTNVPSDRQAKIKNRIRCLIDNNYVV